MPKFHLPKSHLPKSHLLKSHLLKFHRIQLPVQHVALIDYQAQDSLGAIIREGATCTFNSLDGSDAPTGTYWVKIDSEYNMEWAARPPNAASLQRHLLENS